MQIQDGAVFVEQGVLRTGQAVSSVAIRGPNREEKARPRTAVREVSPPTANSAAGSEMDRLAVGGTPDEVRDRQGGSSLADVALPDEASVSRSKSRAESAAQPPVTRRIAKDAAAPIPIATAPTRENGSLQSKTNIDRTGARESSIACLDSPVCESKQRILEPTSKPILRTLIRVGPRVERKETEGARIG